MSNHWNSAPARGCSAYTGAPYEILPAFITLVIITRSGTLFNIHVDHCQNLRVPGILIIREVRSYWLQLKWDKIHSQYLLLFRSWIRES